MNRWKLAPLVGALLAATAACGGSDDPDTAATSVAGTSSTSTSTSQVSSTTQTPDVSSTTQAPDVSSTTQAPAVTSTSQAPDVTSTSTSERPEGRSTSIVGLLGRLPLTTLDDPDGGRVESAQIMVADTVVAAELAGLPRPDTEDLDSLVQWYVDLALAGPVESGGTGYWFTGTGFPAFGDAIARAEELEEVAEFGFSPFAIDAYASVDAFPNQMAVFSGDLAFAEDPAGDLIEVGAGILSAGDGEDFSVNPAERTIARPLGRPHRVAESGGEIAVSLSTSLIGDWLAGGPSLTDEPDLLAAAEQLDVGGSVAAFLFLADFEPFEGGEELDLDTIDVPFSAVGVGTAAVGSTPGNVIAYVFDDDVAASTALASIDVLWRDGVLLDRSAPITDFFEIVSVEQRGRTVVVTTTTTDVSTTRMPIDMVFRLDQRFTHSG